MRLTNHLNQLRRVLVLGIALVMMFIPMGGALTAPDDHAGPAPSVGLVCEIDPNATFTLSALPGYISMADGNTIFMWSYGVGRDDFQFPGPVLCVNEGQTVTIVLHNDLPVPTSMVFPGQVGVMANGVPSAAQFDGSGKLTSLAQTVAPGGSITYSFVASRPGTFLYQSGTNPGIQVQMGLHGALVVRPALGANFAYNDPETEFDPEDEYLMMLGEIDPLLHQAIERGETFDMRNYKARYFLINGRTFPDTLAPNNASWLPTQPYGSLAHIYPYDPVTNPLPALSRYIGVGTEIYPFHPHAFNSDIIGRDGFPVKGPGGENLWEEKFSIPIGPVQTTDALWSWRDTENWSDTNPVPIDIPSDQNLTFGLFWGGTPYLGNTDTLPTGTTTFNQCGEFYHIAHNHALQQITGWGVVLIGQVTFTRIDPPLPNNCP